MSICVLETREKVTKLQQLHLIWKFKYTATIRINRGHNKNCHFWTTVFSKLCTGRNKTVLPLLKNRISPPIITTRELRVIASCLPTELSLNVNAWVIKIKQINKGKYLLYQPSEFNGFYLVMKAWSRVTTWLAIQITKAT